LLLLCAVTCLLGVGFWLLPIGLRGLRLWSVWHERLAAGLIGRTPGARVQVEGFGPSTVRRQIGEPATRRELRWLPIHFIVGTVVGLVALLGVGVSVGSIATIPLAASDTFGSHVQFFGVTPNGWWMTLGLGALQVLVGMAILVFVVPPAARWSARTTVRVLAPSESERLARRVDDLSATRAGVLDAHSAELRRIERDLHDGAQARLTALSMQIGLARDHEDPAVVSELLAQAHDVAEEAMLELREVVRTIYPPILADRGLEGAVRSLCSAASVPVEVEIDLDRTAGLPSAVEAAAYFVLAESLTNIARHSQASIASVELAQRSDDLLVRVCDDGRGGADGSRGTGLKGIDRRIDALDGSTAVHSPSGGPTTITVELPCEW
jgi:signal transduction histidine kinase